MNLSFVDVILGLALSLIIIVMMAEDDPESRISEEGFLVHLTLGPDLHDASFRLEDSKTGEQYSWSPSSEPSGQMGFLDLQYVGGEILVIGELTPDQKLEIVRGAFDADRSEDSGGPVERNPVREQELSHLLQRNFEEIAELARRVQDLPPTYAKGESLDLSRQSQFIDFTFPNKYGPLRTSIEVFKRRKIPPGDIAQVDSYLVSRFPLLWRQPTWLRQINSPEDARDSRYNDNPPIALFGYVAGGLVYDSTFIGDAALEKNESRVVPAECTLSIEVVNGRAKLLVEQAGQERFAIQAQ